MRRGSTTSQSQVAVRTAAAALAILLAGSSLAAAAGSRRGKSRSTKRVTRSASRVTYQPGKGMVVGNASWYGPGFHGRRTASGERFNRNAMTLAHRHLPFGTRVRITNLKNGKILEGRVNDRGPFHGNRVVDLSQGMARRLGIGGVGPVKVEVVPKAPKAPKAASRAPVLPPATSVTPTPGDD